eukprot:9495358-Pyramimonas_sp.AAC.1
MLRWGERRGDMANCLPYLGGTAGAAYDVGLLRGRAGRYGRLYVARSEIGGARVDRTDGLSEGATRRFIFRIWGARSPIAWVHPRPSYLAPDLEHRALPGEPYPLTTYNLP